MKKRIVEGNHGILAAIAVLFMMLMLSPVRAEAAEDNWYEDYSYKLDDEAETITLWKYTGTDSEVFVPKSAVIGGRTYRTTFESGYSHFLFGYNQDITAVTFESGFIFPEDCSALFEFCTSLTSVTFPADLDTSGVRRMHSMFDSCNALASVDVSMFDTGNVEDFHGMFFSCGLLTQLDLSNFDTRKATDMGYMFSCCKNLKSLDLSGFDTSNVENMECMFSNCNAMESLNISGFDTSSVTNMHAMFSYCISLKHLDISSFDTGTVTTMKEMFSSCKALTELDVSGFDTSNVKSFFSMFSQCPFNTLDLSGFDTGNVTNMSYMFSNMTKLTRIDLSGFDMSSVEDCYSMFLGTTSLMEIVTPKAMSDAGTSFNSSKKYARKDDKGIYLEPLYGDLTEAPAQTVIYRYDKYTVKFNANGGEGEMEYQIIQRGAAIPLNRNQFTRENYTFLGWMKSLASGEITYADGELVTDLTYDGGNVYLYAKWRRNASFIVTLPAIVYLTENQNGTELSGTLAYHLEYAGESSDYVSITGEVSKLSDGNGNTIPLTAENSKEKWKLYDRGVTRDSVTGISSGDGTITIRSAESIDGKDSGSYSGSIAVTIRSGTDAG